MEVHHLSLLLDTVLLLHRGKIEVVRFLWDLQIAHHQDIAMAEQLVTQVTGYVLLKQLIAD